MGCGDEASVGEYGDRCHRTFMSFECSDGFSAVGVPDSQGAVVGCGDRASVGEHSDGSNPTFMSFECSDGFSAVRIPDP